MAYNPEEIPSIGPLQSHLIETGFPGEQIRPATWLIAEATPNQLQQHIRASRSYYDAGYETVHSALEVMEQKEDNELAAAYMHAREPQPLDDEAASVRWTSLQREVHSNVEISADVLNELIGFTPEVSSTQALARGLDEEKRLQTALREEQRTLVKIPNRASNITLLAGGSVALTGGMMTMRGQETWTEALHNVEQTSSGNLDHGFTAAGIVLGAIGLGAKLGMKRLGHRRAQKLVKQAQDSPSNTCRREI